MAGFEMVPTSEALAAILDAARHRQDRTFRYGISSATECARKHTYAAQAHDRGEDPPPTDNPVRWTMASIQGTSVGEWLEGIARDLGFETQVPVEVPNEHGLIIVGTLDLMGPDFVSDFKLLGDSAWKRHKGEPSKANRTQVHCYARVKGKPRAAVWQLRNALKGEEIETVVHEEPTDPSCMDAVIEHWREVDSHRQLGTLPPRAYEEPHPLFCRTCPWKIPCWTETTP